MLEEVEEESTSDKESSDMPVWQNHEQRITALEITTANISNDFKEVKEKIDAGNDEQTKKLESFYERLADDFFATNREKRSYKWKFATKVIAALVGSGGILYIIIENIMEGF